MMRVRTLSLPILAAALALGGCTDFKRAIGMEKVIPDEFSVVARAPLAIPPDYALRPPRPGAATSQEVSTTEQARQTIFRATDNQAAALPGAENRTTGENELLKAAGASNALPDIRDTVNKEAIEASNPVDTGFVDRLLFWRSPEPNPGTGIVIDPAQEAERLQNARTAAAPLPQDMSAPPTIERQGRPTVGAL